MLTMYYCSLCTIVPYAISYISDLDVPWFYLYFFISMLACLLTSHVCSLCNQRRNHVSSPPNQRSRCPTAHVISLPNQRSRCPTAYVSSLTNQRSRCTTAYVSSLCNQRRNYVSSLPNQRSRCPTAYVSSLTNQRSRCPCPTAYVSSLRISDLDVPRPPLCFLY